MYIDPNTFNFMSHWSDDDKKMAAKITHNLVRRYVKLLAEDAVSEAFLAVLKAKRKYGDKVTPESISGHIRTHLYRTSSKTLPKTNKSHKIQIQDEEITAQCISKQIKNADDYLNDEIDIFSDLKKILEDKEYRLLLNIAVLEMPFKDRTERRFYKKILEKIRDTYHA